MKKIVLALCFVLTGSLLSADVIIDRVSIKNKELFGIVFEKDKQEFFAKVASLQGVTLHQYMTEAYLVTEMNLDISGGSQQIRIYATKLLKPSVLAEKSELPAPKTIKDIPSQLDKLSEPVTSKIEPALPQTVFKSYPVTTHAKTVEYLLQDEEQVFDLYKTLKEVWISPIGVAQPTDESKKENNDKKRPPGLFGCTLILSD